MLSLSPSIRSVICTITRALDEIFGYLKIIHFVKSVLDIGFPKFTEAPSRLTPIGSIYSAGAKSKFSSSSCSLDWTA